LVGKIEAVAAIRYEDAELAARSPRISSRERLALDLSNQEFPHARTDYSCHSRVTISTSKEISSEGEPRRYTQRGRIWGMQRRTSAEQTFSAVPSQPEADLEQLPEFPNRKVW
jgi:hypothetical protein